MGDLPRRGEMRTALLDSLSRLKLKPIRHEHRESRLCKGAKAGALSPLFLLHFRVFRFGLAEQRNFRVGILP